MDVGKPRLKTHLHPSNFRSHLISTALDKHLNALSALHASYTTSILLKAQSCNWFSYYNHHIQLVSPVYINFYTFHHVSLQSCQIYWLWLWDQGRYGPLHTRYNQQFNPLPRIYILTISQVMVPETVVGLLDMRGLSGVVFVRGALVATMSSSVPVEDGALRPPGPRQNPQFTPIFLACTLNRLRDQFLAFQHLMFLPSLTSTTQKTTTIVPIATITSSSNSLISQLTSRIHPSFGMKMVVFWS